MPFLSALLLAAAISPHPYTVADWTQTRSSSAVAVSPDARTILYRETDAQTKGPDKHVWYLTSADGTNTRKLTLPKHFTPYGFTSATQLYGAYTVKDVDQLALWNPATKTPRTLTKFTRDIASALPSPDGTRFAVIADSRPADPLAKVHEIEENTAAQLFVIPATGGTAQRWCPATSDVGAIAWSPDGTRIAALSQTPRIGWHTVKGAVDICSATGAHHIADINNSVINQAPFPGSGIAWADGGRNLAFVSTTTDVLTPDHVWTVPVDGGTAHDITPDLDGSAMTLRGGPHGDVWVLVARGVQNDVERLTANGLQPFLTWHDGVVALPVVSPLANAQPAIVADIGDPTHYGNIAVAHGTELVKITHTGDAQLANVALGRVIRHRWTAADGTKLEAIVTLPAGYDGKPTKFVVLPHGGPEANDVLRLDSFSRIIAGAGYVVMQPEYRGSTGYGSAHMQAIYQHFGDTAYRDVDAATTEAVAQHWADPNRLGIFGWSAGGFMTSWTITQTHRYKAAVEGAGINDWLSFIDSSDVEQSDYDARPTTGDPEPFFKYSAARFPDQVTTPLLILHGKADARVPWVQGFEFFNRLKERGKTVEMISYPGSNHFPRLWQQRQDVLNQTVHWLQRYNP